jgi:hypothetical protein
MEDGEAVERRWQFGQFHVVMSHLDIFGIPAPTPVESCQLERVSNHGMDRIPILDMKKIHAMAEDMCLIVLLDPEPLSRMQPSEALLQFFHKLLRQTWLLPYVLFHFSANLFSKYSYS